MTNAYTNIMVTGADNIRQIFLVQSTSRLNLDRMDVKILIDNHISNNDLFDAIFGSEKSLSLSEYIGLHTGFACKLQVKRVFCCFKAYSENLLEQWSPTRGL